MAPFDSAIFATSSSMSDLFVPVVPGDQSQTSPCNQADDQLACVRDVTFLTMVHYREVITSVAMLSP